MNLELMKQQLTGEYREAFSAVWVYGTMKNIAADLLEERLTELYDSLYTAQIEKKDVRRIIGSSTERFCKNFYEDYTFADRLRQLPALLYRWAWVVLVMVLLPLSGSSERGTTQNILPILFAIGVGLVFELVCRFVFLPLMCRSRKIKSGTWSNIAFISLIVMFAATIVFQASLSVELEVPALPLAIGAGAYIAVFFAVRSYLRYKEFGTIRDVRKQMRKDSYYKEISDQQLEQTVLKTWQKQYTKFSSKGKATPDSYIGMLKKNEKANDIANTAIDLFMAACFISIVVNKVQDYQGVADLLVYLAFMGTLMFFFWRFISGAFRRGSAIRKNLIRECETAGQTMPDFITERLAVNS